MKLFIYADGDLCVSLIIFFLAKTTSTVTSSHSPIFCERVMTFADKTPPRLKLHNIKIDPKSF